MKLRLGYIGAGVLLVCAFIFYLPEENNSHNDQEVEVAFLERETQDFANSDGKHIHRRLQESESDESIPSWSWRDDETFRQEFNRLFKARFSSSGGEEATLAWIMDVTREKLDAGRGVPAVRAYELLASSGVVCGPEGHAGFGELVFGGDLIASNSLRAQATNYGEWLRDRDLEGYYLPKMEMSFEPLRYPPEMHFASIITDYKNGLPKEMLEEAAAHRNHLINYYAQLYQERMILRPSLEFALAASDRQISDNEKEDFFQSSVGEYGKINAAMQEVAPTYVDGMYTIASAYGYHVQ
jgi:hypothetical protein